MNVATLISLSTVRLLCGNAGNVESVGTGFFFNINLKHHEEEFMMPMIFTNKHVVERFNEIYLTLTVRERKKDISDMVADPYDQHKNYRINDCQQRIIKHPDPIVDLCAISINDINFSIFNDGKELRNCFLDESFFVPENDRKYIRPIEPIIMIGYPNGLWDEKNNRPLARRGSTASHPFLKWNDKLEFVIDAACFPGSSGSPVFLFEDTMYRTKDNYYAPGTRARLIGVLASGPLYYIEGELIQKNIPTSTELIPVSQNMMNLGNVVHASAINDIVNIAKQYFFENYQHSSTYEILS